MKCGITCIKITIYYTNAYLCWATLYPCITPKIMWSYLHKINPRGSRFYADMHKTNKNQIILLSTFSEPKCFLTHFYFWSARFVRYRSLILFTIHHQYFIADACRIPLLHYTFATYTHELLHLCRKNPGHRFLFPSTNPSLELHHKIIVEHQGKLINFFN